MASSGLRAGLLQEILTMAVDTLRTNKMRSALTILGVVIGITSIVSITALIRGFDESFKDLFRQIGPSTMFVTKFSIVSFSQGKEFRDLIKRPNITVEDAKALERSPLVETVAVQLGGGPGTRPERFTHGNNATKRMAVIGASANFGETNSIPLEFGRVFTQAEVDRRRPVVVLGNAPGKVLFPATDPIGKQVRIGRTLYTVVGVFGKRPNPLGGSQADEFAIIPHTTWQKVYGADALRIFGVVHRDVSIIVIPREDVPRDAAMREVEEIMRARHGLRLDQESDFDIGTQEAIFKIWERISSGIFMALVAISSIALMVGGIGVMAIMTISVTERTREIGVRKALGARRREILWQFLLEAVFLTSLGGVIGIVLGATIGWLINVVSGFPISLPWWSFAIGIGFSASVGIFFGIVPAFKAARLDPDRGASLRVAATRHGRLRTARRAPRRNPHDGGGDAAQQQAALGADHPRRGHRHHLDRQRHRPAARLRRVVQGPVPADRADDDVRDEVQLRQPLAGQVVPRPDQAAEHHRRRRPRDRGARRSSTRSRCSSAA